MSSKKNSDSKTSVHIGISDSSQELHFETDLEADKVLALAKASLSDQTILQLTDLKERVILVPAAKISYIQIGDGTDLKVGFTAL
jgi:hypothetical protein